MHSRPPLAVWVAVAALVAIAVQAALAIAFGRAGDVGWAMYAFGGVLWAALVVGLVRRSRLAWLWGRALTVILGVMIAAMAAAGAVAQRWGALAVVTAIGGIAVPLLVAAIALSRRAAYDFFGLVCPVCAARTSLGDDLLFRQARCRTCHHVW